VNFDPAASRQVFQPNSTFAPAPAVRQVKLPRFWPRAPEAFFEQAEASFRTHGVVDSHSMYDSLVQALPLEVVEDSIDILRRCRDSVKPYELLKGELIRRHIPSTNARLEDILSQSQIGNRKPSEFYRHMANMAASAPEMFPEGLIRSLWCRRLPDLVQLQVLPHLEGVLDRILAIADAAHEVSRKNTGVFSIDNSASATSAKMEEKIEKLQAEVEKISFRPNEKNSPKKSIWKKGRQGKSPPARDPAPKLCYPHYRYGKEAFNCRSADCPMRGEFQKSQNRSKN